MTITLARPSITLPSAHPVSATEPAASPAARPTPPLAVIQSSAPQASQRAPPHVQLPLPRRGRLVRTHLPRTTCSPVYWFLTQTGMIAGFFTVWPANAWLIRAGIKEAT